MVTAARGPKAAMDRIQGKVVLTRARGRTRRRAVGAVAINVVVAEVAEIPAITAVGMPVGTVVEAAVEAQVAANPDLPDFTGARNSASRL